MFFVLLLAGAGVSAARAAEISFRGRVIRNVTYVQRGVKPLRMTVYIPEQKSAGRPVVMVIHGGGFVGGTRKQMAPLCMTIANQGMIVFNVEYRLAPAYPFPAPIEDVRCGLRWIAKHATSYGGDPSRLGVTGESAGAYLAAMTLFPPPDAFNDQPCPEGAPARPAIKAAVLYYGVYDLIKSYDYDFPGMHWIYRLALRGKPEDDPEHFYLLSPIAYLRPGLPPILIQVGLKDPLYPESKNLYDRLKEMGAPVSIITYPDAGHAFAVYLKPPPGPVNLDPAAAFFKEHL